jgi:hypothetical protein
MFELRYFGNNSAGHNGTGAGANRGNSGDSPKWRVFFVVFERKYD